MKSQKYRGIFSAQITGVLFSIEQNQLKLTVLVFPLRMR